MDAINIMKLTKYYGKHRGIVNLELSVKKGEYIWYGCRTR